MGGRSVCCCRCCCCCCRYVGGVGLYTVSLSVAADVRVLVLVVLVSRGR